jgi:hypothetical protein
MPLSDYDREHIQEILDGKGTWFTAYLLRTIALADSCTRRRLARSFPEEVRLVETTLGMPHPSRLDQELDYLYAKADMIHLALLRNALQEEYNLAVGGGLVGKTCH